MQQFLKALSYIHGQFNLSLPRRRFRERLKQIGLQEGHEYKDMTSTDRR